MSLLLIFILFIFIDNMTNANPIPHHKFQMKNENGFAKLLCSLRRSTNPGHNVNGIVMAVDDPDFEERHCNPWFSACDLNINNQLSRILNNADTEILDEVEFSICQHGKTLRYDELLGIFSVTHNSDENFKDVTARAKVQDGKKIKIAMRTEPTFFLLSKENARVHGGFIRVFHGHIEENPILESTFELRR